MNLQCLNDDSLSLSIVRIFSFSPIELREFFELVSRLATGREESVDICSLPFVQPIDIQRLEFSLQSWDQSVLRIGAGNDFALRLTPGGWDNIIFLIEPFKTRRQGFQWLATGDADILLSQSGRW